MSQEALTTPEETYSRYKNKVLFVEQFEAELADAKAIEQDTDQIRNEHVILHQILVSADLAECKSDAEEVLKDNRELMQANLGEYQQEAAALATAAGVELNFFYE